jgi:hydrogenase expression/formation protein HypC
MRVEKIVDEKRAVVSQGKVSVEIDISLLPAPAPGEYVIVHAGYAIQTLSLEDAQERLDLFRAMAELTATEPASE